MQSFEQVHSDTTCLEPVEMITGSLEEQSATIPCNSLRASDKEEEEEEEPDVDDPFFGIVLKNFCNPSISLENTAIWR